MSKFLFDVNGDIVSTLHYDEMSDTTTIKQIQDVDPYLEANKAERDSQTSLSKMGDGLQKIASIPLVLIDQWRKEIGSDPLHLSNRGWLMRRLNDPAYSKLRTRTGNF
ncbi:MAG: hypothetical protein JKY52_09340 [Flavobacteriales bacterium]|nr:hypothetical protein [Flavobacteriales bacterium]